MPRPSLSSTSTHLELVEAICLQSAALFVPGHGCRLHASHYVSQDSAMHESFCNLSEVHRWPIMNHEVLRKSFCSIIWARTTVFSKMPLRLQILQRTFRVKATNFKD
ncbi:uncharacterized protein LAESUDRAFT_322593 [Laetiporus sulphureus 93-53]|uniref:Uncharacterized protein n=1 Tax=Laetiporus sulphureus 93-53 TaxID=1314785 RepID=A0A165D213_9APHY|nr:uncharacterized protein LAESUDRAFT_322593 [Laetiporus sulphureus 93-53]KZT03997.1 hypothetical protein LAESUDRAFT_322593 [Laetiporus sulphureus 93-53]